MQPSPHGQAGTVGGVVPHCCPPSAQTAALGGPPPSTLCSCQHSILTLPPPPGSPLGSQRAGEAYLSPARWSWRSWKAPTGPRPKGPGGPDVGPGLGQVSTPHWSSVSLLSPGMSKPPQQGPCDSWNLCEGGPGRASTRRTDSWAAETAAAPNRGWAAHSGHTICELSPQQTPPPPTPQACLLGLQSSHLDSPAVQATVGLLGPRLEHPPSIPFFLQTVAPQAGQQEVDGHPAYSPRGRPGVLHAGVSQAESWGPAGVRLDFGCLPIWLPGMGEGRPAVQSGLRKPPRASPVPPQGEAWGPGPCSVEIAN